MKICPTCNERYDEEIIIFCTKDGTPLVEEEQPSFTALPSESHEEPDDDFGEETVIRRNPPSGSGSGNVPDQSERFVIPTDEPAQQHVRPRTTQAYYPPPPPPNTVKTVILTIIGTLVILGCGAGLFWLLQKEPPANVNTNFDANLYNQNANLNTNLAFDSNFNFNTNANFSSDFNLNTNFNANMKSPSPTPTPKPSPSTSPSPTPSPAAESPSPTPRTSPSPRPSQTQTPRTGPRPPTMLGNRPPGNN